MIFPLALQGARLFSIRWYIGPCVDGWGSVLFGLGCSFDSCICCFRFMERKDMLAAFLGC